MSKKNQSATPATVEVAEVAAELSASPEKLEAFIAEHQELTAKTEALEAELETAKATIAELMESNENLETTGAKAAKNTVKVKGKVYELAIPSSYLKVEGEMVLVNAEYLNKNPKLAEKLLSEGHSIFKQEDAQ